jgi:hypothetical protein
MPNGEWNLMIRLTTGEFSDEINIRLEQVKETKVR